MRHRLALDRNASTLDGDPGPSHNRLHPDIPPVATIDAGDELEADCRDRWQARWAGRPPPRRCMTSSSAPTIR